MKRRLFLALLPAIVCCLHSCEEPTGGTTPPPAEEPCTINGYTYVDMGLSVKWASCNIGALDPEDAGDHIAWGELTGKAEYTRDNSEYFGVQTDCIAANPQCDAATVRWGSPWRMPTAAEVQELIDNTASSWTTRNGVPGRLYISIRNGNSIFLPAAGIRFDDSHKRNGSRGYYWSASPREDALASAYALFFGEKDSQCYWSSRLDGLCIRPVTE